MHLSLNKYHAYWIGVWVLVGAYIVYADSVASSQVSYAQHFSKNQFHISYLFPLGRTKLEQGKQIIEAEPVYVTVYAPRLYDLAKISIMFDTQPEGWSIGVQTAPGFSYALVPLASEKQQTIQLPIERSITEQNRLRFIFAHDGSVSEPLGVESLQVTLSKPRNPYSKTLLNSLSNAYARITSLF